MRPTLLLRYLSWEARGSWGRLIYFVLCLAVGVTAVVAVAGLAAGLDAGIRAEARELLAADLQVRSRRPLPEELDAVLGQLPGARRADLREMVTVVATSSAGERPPRTQLVELKVVDGPYPFYGELDLEPARPLQDLLGSDGAVVHPDLLSRLDLAIGERLLLGGEPFTIRGVVRLEPDDVADAFTLGPRVFLSLAGLERTPLVGMGSRVEYRALVRLAGEAGAEQVAAAAELLEASLPDAEYLRVETYAEAQPSLRRGLDRLERYLGLVALLSLLVGGVGAAQAVRAWLATRIDSIAVLKCLGVRPREVLAIYLLFAVALGLVASLVGAATGGLLQHGLAVALGDLLPRHLLRPFQPQALLRGLGLGIGAALAFSLPALVGILRVTPSRVLRRDAEPLPGSRFVPAAVAGLMIAAIAGMAALQSRSLELASQFTGGVLATAGLLAAGAWLLTRAVARVPRETGRVWLRHGVAALARPGAATVGAIVALGLGLLVLVALRSVEERLGEELDAELPGDAPSAFLVDIQSDQWPGVEAVLEEAGASRIDSVPVIMARLRSIDGRPVGELVEERRGDRWALTREQRLTYLDELPADNEITSGALWAEPQLDELSLEEEFAGELGASLGSTIGFDVQGVPFELVVTSIRRVDWESFGINFYLVVEPGVLDQAPQSRLAAVRLPAGAEEEVRGHLARRFPNVTFIQIRDILDRLLLLLERLAWGVRLLGSFTVVAAIAILAGAVSASTLRRSREVALLKTLGMTRLGVLAAFATEYTLIGVVAAAVGCTGGTVLAWLVLTRGMEIDWQAQPGTFFAVAGTGIALAVVAGLLASVSALRRRPLEVLRHE